METCCEPLCCEPLSHADATTMSTKLKALSDPTRLRLFSIISSGEAMCACDLTEPLGVGQPTVSHHLKVLRQAGLVDSEKRGRWVYYRPVPERLDILSRALTGNTRQNG